MARRAHCHHQQQQGGGMLLQAQGAVGGLQRQKQEQQQGQVAMMVGELLGKWELIGVLLTEVVGGQ